MAQKKHLRGVGSKEQRKYEHIKKSAEESGRYGDRAEEVAARTVMKLHKEASHKEGE
jgi:RNA 3'-terminal phosphate cyclase